jgi:hypothetical protein
VVATLEHLKGMGSNCSSLFSEVNQLALSMVESFKPDMEKYKLHKDFSDMYHSGETFVQVFFYDRTANRYASDRTNFNISTQHRLELQAAMINYNLQLEVAQRMSVEKVKGITSIDDRTYFYCNRTGSELGYAHASFHERNEERENEESVAQEKDHREEEQGPYGGAFRDEFDFARHVGIKLDR